MGFRLTPRSMTLDDFELLYGRILSEFHVTSRVWEATTGEPPIQFVSSYYISMISLHNAVAHLPER